MRTGRIDREIEIEEEVTTKNPDYGNLVKSYRFYALLWAEYVPLQGNAAMEKFSAEAIRPTEVALFRTRWYPGLNVKMRILYDGKIYNIRNISDTGKSRQRMLEIVGEAEVGTPEIRHQSQISVGALSLQGNTPSVTVTP